MPCRGVVCIVAVVVIINHATFEKVSGWIEGQTTVLYGTFARVGICRWSQMGNGINGKQRKVLVLLELLDAEYTQYPLLMLELNEYFVFYNSKRPRQALGNLTLNAMYPQLAVAGLESMTSSAIMG